MDSTEILAYMFGDMIGAIPEPWLTDDFHDMHTGEEDMDATIFLDR